MIDERNIVLIMQFFFEKGISNPLFPFVKKYQAHIIQGLRQRTLRIV